MNHAMIAAEALRYRLKLVQAPLVQDDEWNVEELAVRVGHRRRSSG